MANEIPEQHCSRWGGIPQRNLSLHNRLHIETLVLAYNKGPWNIPVSWDRIEWGSQNYTRFPVCGSMATFDFDVLTRLVILAHEKCVRVEVSPCNMQRFNVEMWTRDRRSARTHHVHPTIESSVVELRKSLR